MKTNVISNDAKMHTVIVMLEAKPGKELILKNALMAVKEASEQESSCLKYSVYQDTNNPALFTLYEQWQSKERHAAQFTKPYIIEFGNRLDDLLLKPYQALLGNEL